MLLDGIESPFGSLDLSFHQTADLTNRKVVALNPVNLSEENSSADIQLRKFAG